ncbi:MAG: hypothetical protein DRO11_07015, partial [Methanobacteriota archaeon]
MPREVFSHLSEKVQQTLTKAGFTQPSPPQSQAIDPILRGENVLIIAQTGSGKTEAAILPIL